jgi:hypothetical protein
LVLVHLRTRPGPAQRQLVAGDGRNSFIDTKVSVIRWYYSLRLLPFGLVA